jgi:hypothetical protein
MTSRPMRWSSSSKSALGTGTIGWFNPWRNRITQPSYERRKGIKRLLICALAALALVAGTFVPAAGPVENSADISVLRPMYVGHFPSLVEPVFEDVMAALHVDSKRGNQFTGAIEKIGSHTDPATGIHYDIVLSGRGVVSPSGEVHFDGSQTIDSTGTTLRIRLNGKLGITGKWMGGEIRVDGNLPDGFPVNEHAVFLIQAP